MENNGMMQRENNARLRSLPGCRYQSHIRKKSMVVCDGYSIEYFPKSNRFVITLPQTMLTTTNTVSMVVNRRTDFTVEEQAAILAIVKAFAERE